MVFELVWSYGDSNPRPLACHGKCASSTAVRCQQETPRATQSATGHAQDDGQMTVKTILKQRWITPIPVARKRQSGKVPPASKPGQTHARAVTIREAPMWCASRRSPNIRSQPADPGLSRRHADYLFGGRLAVSPRCTPAG